MLAPSMIQVSPQIKLKAFQLAGETFQPRGLRLAGMRMLIEAQSPSGKTVWKDFPSSHGLYAPCVYDPSTRKIEAAPGMGWWSEPMRQVFETPEIKATRLQIHARRDAKSWIILNALDNVFGHSLLLLLNAQFYLEKFPDHGLIVIATPELLRYIPEDAHQIWELKTKPSETELFHTILDINLKKLCVEYDVHIATAPSHPDPARYDLRRFQIPTATGVINTQAPRILFIHRGTRQWGGTRHAERSRLEQLAKWLRRFWPQARLEIFGHVSISNQISGWSDFTRRSDSNYDDSLIQALSEADLVLGAHGSSMLLPSAISKLVLELVPLDKQPSLLQDFLLDNNRSSREHLWRRRFIYGDSTLSDVSPRQLAQLINAMISMQAQFEFYQTTDASDPLRNPEQIEKDFAQKIAPQMQMFQASLEQTLRLPLSARFWSYLRRLAAARD